MLAVQLKEATKDAHQQVEKKVVQRIKSISSEADYIDLLKHFYAYFSKVEAAVAPYLNEEIPPDFKERRNASAIRSDIEVLGGSTDALPAATAPDLSNPLQAMGALYVLEGSMLGGPYIVQMLKKAGIDQGFSFFNGYGVHAPEKWQAFTAALDSLAESEQDQQQAIGSAKETFRHFGEVFS